MSSSKNSSKQEGYFPEVPVTDEYGVVAQGRLFNKEILIEAYAKGIFPWPHLDDLLGEVVLWCCPLERGILDFENFKVPRSVRKFLEKSDYRVTQNHCFETVMRECRKSFRKDQEGTWILEDMIPAYKDLHDLGMVTSYECWQGDELIGGLYGVDIEGLFAGESMFFKKREASKACLIELVKDQQALGRSWIDTQMVTPVLKSFGATEMTQEEFLRRRAL